MSPNLACARASVIAAALGALVIPDACTPFDAASSSSSTSSSSGGGLGDGSADGSTSSDGGTDARDDASAPLDGSVTNNCTLDSPVVAGSTETSSAATNLDSVVTGFLDLYGYTNIKLATAKCVRIYIEKISPANGKVPQVLIGVYSDSLSHPTTLLAQASFTAAIGWNTAPLNIPVSFSPTATVWIGASVNVGEISVRSHQNGVYCAALPKFHNIALPSFALPTTLVNPMSSSSICQAAFTITE